MIEKKHTKNVVVFCIGIMIIMPNACSRKSEQSSAGDSKITVHALGNEFLLGPRMDDSAKFLVFLPLIFSEASGVQQGGLIQSWESSADYREWIFRLRRDVRWHDGVPTTAHDIKFSLELFFHPDVLYMVDFPRPESIFVLDDFTFRIKFTRPQWALESWTVYYPKHLLEELDPKDFYKWDFWKKPVGNGPYRYVRHVPKTMIELEANPDYYKSKPRIQHVILKFGGGTPLTELLSGNVDVIQSDLSDVPKLNDDPRFRVYFKRTWFVGTIFWNHRLPLFKESAIRKALTMAINRRELARLLYYPDEVPLFDGITSTFQYFADDLPKPWPYDPQRAEQLLEDAGWRDRDKNGVREKDRREFRFTAIIDKSIGLELDKAAVFVQDQLKRVGIRMEIQELQGTLNTRFRAGDFEAVFGKFQNSPIGYENTEIISLLKQAKNEPDPEKIKLIYEKIMPIYTADIPMTILYPETKVLIAHKRVRGLEDVSDPAWFMEYLWIEEESEN